MREGFIRSYNKLTGEVREVVRFNSHAVNLMLRIVAEDVQWANNTATCDDEQLDVVRDIFFESSNPKVADFLNSELKRKYESKTITQGGNLK